MIEAHSDDLTSTSSVEDRSSPSFVHFPTDQRDNVKDATNLSNKYNSFRSKLKTRTLKFKTCK